MGADLRADAERGTEAETGGGLRHIFQLGNVKFCLKLLTVLFNNSKMVSIDTKPGGYIIDGWEVKD